MRDILWIIIEIFTNVIEIYLLFELCKHFLFKRIEKRDIYGIIIFIFSFTLLMMHEIFKNESLYYLISYTMLLLSISVLYTGQWYKKIIVFITYIFLISFIEFLAIGLLYLILNCDVCEFYNKTNIRFIGIIISKLLLFIFVKLFILKQPIRNEKINNGLVYILIIFSILCLGIIVATSVGLYDINIDKDDFFPVFALTVALICIVFFIVYEKIQKQIEKQREVEAVNEHLKLVNKYTEDINKVIQDYRIFKLNFKNHYSY